MPDTIYLPLSFQGLAKQIHENANAHGFWPPEGRNFGEMLALIHSEISEALEEHREGRPAVWFKHAESCAHQIDEEQVCDCPSKPEGTAVELIDAMIRILDTLYSELKGSPYSIDKVMVLKMAYNAQREHMHGKKY